MRPTAEDTPPRWLREVVLAAFVVAPLALPPSGAMPPALDAAYAPKTVAVALLGLALLYLASPRTIRPPRLPAWIAVAAGVLLCAVIASSLTSPHHSAALRTAVVRVILVLLALTVARSSFPDPRAVTMLLVGCALVLAGFTIFEHLADARLADVRFNPPAVTLVHRNNLAFHLAAALPFAAAFACTRRSAPALAWGLAVALLAVALLFTQSRTAWLAGAVGVATVLAARRSAPAALAISVVLVGVFMLALPGAVTGAVRDRAKATWSLEDSAWTSREQGTLHAATRIAERPLLGWGPGSYVVEHLQDPGVGRFDHANNDVLTTAYESGVLAGVALAVLVFGLPLALLRRREASGLTGALVAWAIVGVTNTPLALAPSSAHYWLLYGLGLRALLEMERR